MDQEQLPLRPTVRKGLHRVAEEADYEDVEVKRVEVVFRTNGEVVYRMHPAEGGESIGGVLTPTDE